jgi:septal ring factor EnvC (AmiA/AmiB activator)
MDAPSLERLVIICLSALSPLVAAIGVYVAWRKATKQEWGRKAREHEDDQKMFATLLDKFDRLDKAVERLTDAVESFNEKLVAYGERLSTLEGEHRTFHNISRHD